MKLRMGKALTLEWKRNDFNEIEKNLLNREQMTACRELGERKYANDNALGLSAQVIGGSVMF